MRQFGFDLRNVLLHGAIVGEIFTSSVKSGEVLQRLTEVG